MHGCVIMQDAGTHDLSAHPVHQLQSCHGHTEGTAGMTGALLALTTGQQQHQAPIVNLRDVNPYVNAAFSDWRSRHGLIAAPSRQLMPAGTCAPGGSNQRTALAGTSSFGMSGVNAHALVSAQAQLAMDSVPRTPLEWDRSSYWPHPLPHPLLHVATVQPRESRRRMMDCAVDLSAAALAWLYDHQVQGRVLLAGAAMFELASAAVAAGSGTDSRVKHSQARHTVQSLAIPSPCILPADGSPALVRCTVDTASGALEVMGPDRTKHMLGLAGLVVAARIGAPSPPHHRTGSLRLLPSLALPASIDQLAVVAVEAQRHAG